MGAEQQLKKCQEGGIPEGPRHGGGPNAEVEAMVLAKKTLVHLRPGEDCLQEAGVSVTLVWGPAKGTTSGQEPDRC
jgi:hypothetical protein